MRVVNVVATADLRQSLDLELLNSNQWGLYDLDIYPAGYVRDGWIQGRVVVFHTGKLISAGANSVRGAFGNLVHAKSLLVKAGIAKEVKINPRVRNMVASLDLGHAIDLVQLVKNSPNVIYEPEQFPGAMLKTKGESMSFLIFASGKIVIAGAKTLAELKFGARRIARLDSFLWKGNLGNANETA